LSATTIKNLIQLILTKQGSSRLGFILSFAILALIFYPVFTGDYAYLDEAYQLWHNQDGSVFTYFFVQGRWLSGKLFSYLFAHLALVSDLKFIRILSFCSWVFFLEEFFRLGREWQKMIGFDSYLLLLGGIYIACCPSLTIYIGWGSCFVCGIANLLGLWCGHLFFTMLVKKRQSVLASFGYILMIIILGLGSLFSYQTGFSSFLLPFVFYYVKNRSDSFRLIRFAIGGYLVITVLYYSLFLFSLKHASVQASDRASISFDIAGKLGFFFGVPLAQAFSFNFLYDMHSVISQGFPIVLMVAWIVCSWKREHGKPINMVKVPLLFIVLCMLIYAPLLAAKENFASYRTMFMLNLTVVLILLDTIIFYFGRQERNKKIIAVLAFTCFVVIGFRNFRYNFIGPQEAEYSAVRGYFNRTHRAGIQTIYFLRPPERLFYSKYGVNPYNDELGVPSTYRDWTPEPLVKQFILENTGSRIIAENAKVLQFTDRALFEKERAQGQSASMYVDVEGIYGSGNELERK
jgi:hypothetical protein